MKISIITENTLPAPNTQLLKAEHGLSIHTTINGKQILFDTGKTDIFLYNAQLLNINISEVDYLFISHGHYDHGGGLKHFLAANKKAKIYLHKKAINMFYSSANNHPNKYIGLSKKSLEQCKGRIHYISKDTIIDENISLICDFETTFPISPMNSNLLMLDNNMLKQDNFKHEMALLLREKQIYILQTACSHSGVTNMMAKTTKLIGNNINAVIGGFHTHNPSSNIDVDQDYLTLLASELSTYKTNYYTGHCTGNNTINVLKEKLVQNLHPLHTGLCITI